MRLCLCCETLIYNSACCVFLWNSWTFLFLELTSGAIAIATMKLPKSLKGLLLCGFLHLSYVIFKLIVRSFSSSYLVA